MHQLAHSNAEEFLTRYVCDSNHVFLVLPSITLSSLIAALHSSIPNLIVVHLLVIPITCLPYPTRYRQEKEEYEIRRRSADSRPCTTTSS
ncbi:hypothetical protein DL96DRAFT_1721777 [Flagelloscypha sp. PMI_526]|nr:hypothetical protein DL96DRAFT_1721777 [Flagelloscypha sp. PMI_526]